MANSFNKIALVLLSLTIAVCVQAKIAPPSFSDDRISADHVADKIVTHGYALIDAYIKELAEPACSFPNGQFLFFLDRGGQVDLSPGCIYGKVWRTITLMGADGSTQIVVLDGPVSGEPGTPNEEALAGVKKDLATLLSGTSMVVVIKDKETGNEEKFDLGLLDDFQKFTDLMFATIKLSKPLFSEEPAQMTLLPGTLIRINPSGQEKIMEVDNAPIQPQSLKTKVFFGDRENEITINFDAAKREIKLEIDNNAVTTNKKVEVKESRLYIETSTGNKMIGILPSTAVSKVGKITKVEKIELREEAQKPTYQISGSRKAKLLFLMPVTIPVNATVNAETGAITSIKQPWWSFLAR